MFSNSLQEMDRDHLVHSVLPPRLHERRGVTVLESGKGAYLTDAARQDPAGWLLRPLVRQRRLRPGSIVKRRRRADAAAALRHQLLPLRQRARDPSGRETWPNCHRRLDHVFFTLGGSDAVDSAVRFIAFYLENHGRPAADTSSRWNAAITARRRPARD